MRNNIYWIFTLLAVVLLLLTVAPAAWALPHTLNYGGYLTDETGQPLTDDVLMQFSIYTSLEGGIALWSEELSVAVEGGTFAVLLGTVSAFSPELFNYDALYMEVNIAGETLLPRSRISAMPFAFVAENAVGDITPSSISIDGVTVIDESGKWVGDPTGLQGPQGIQGLKGDKGDTGDQGIQGLKGDKGDTGSQGIQGLKGDKGDTGSQGIQGLKGDKGDTGSQGIQGLKGDKGDTGSQGIQGLKGDKGDTGSQGIQGLKGDPGDSVVSWSADTLDCQYGGYGFQVGDGPEQYVCNGDPGEAGPAGEGSSEHSLCKDSDGNYGFVKDGVCVLKYDNSLSTNWATAAASCAAIGGDLCSDSQYSTLRNSTFQLMNGNNAVWSNSFSDNDSGLKSWMLSADDPTATNLYSWACCLNITAQPFLSQALSISGVKVTYLHETRDTDFRAASRICHLRGADLCSKSQLVALRDGGRFAASESIATNDVSDNDTFTFNAILGSSTADNPNISSAQFAYACCGSDRESDFSCSDGDDIGGVCVLAIHNSEDANFYTAARACAVLEADVCSKSEMTVIRSSGSFSVKGWTNDGADNDASRAGGLLSTQPDDPNPTTTLMGYACCK